MIIAGLTITRGDGAGGSAAGRGAGLVLNRGSATLDGVTFTGQVALSHVTVAANRAGYGGGIAMSSGSSGRLHNPTIANRATNPYQTRWNYMGPLLQNDGGNVEHPGTANNQFDHDCAAQITHRDPSLLPLVENGGPTRTMALGAGSGARGAGVATSRAANDQRGLRRAGPCDSGAYSVETAPAGPLHRSACPSYAVEIVGAHRDTIRCEANNCNARTDWPGSSR